MKKRSKKKNAGRKALARSRTRGSTRREIAGGIDGRRGLRLEFVAEPGAHGRVVTAFEEVWAAFPQAERAGIYEAWERGAKIEVVPSCKDGQWSGPDDELEAAVRQRGRLIRVRADVVEAGTDAFLRFMMTWSLLVAKRTRSGGGLGELEGIVVASLADELGFPSPKEKWLPGPVGDRRREIDRRPIR